VRLVSGTEERNNIPPILGQKSHFFALPSHVIFNRLELFEILNLGLELSEQRESFKSRLQSW
jgi:hypothetical protein